MFVKAIGTLLLLGFCYVQLGTSLECYSCNTPTACKAASLQAVTCTDTNANATSLHLGTYFKEDISNVTSVNYDCLFHNYTSVNTNVTYKGCVYRSIDACNLNLKDDFSNFTRQTCKKCSGNRCNPAGTFSSSMITMFASILVIAGYKVLKM